MLIPVFHGERGAGMLCVALAATLAGCSPTAVVPPVVPPVWVESVTNERGGSERILFGSVQPRVETALAFRAGGTVVARLVDPGQLVRAGQTLARIDNADYQLALQVAQAQQRAAQVDAVQADSEAARFARLQGDGSVGAADAERQQARADAAQARLAQAARQTALARNRAAYAELKAPFDGVVTFARVEPGQLVDDSRAVLGLARTGELEVQVDIPEALAAGLANWSASARIGGDTVVLPLRLRELAPGAAPTGRTFSARYALSPPAPGAAVRMGMSAELRLHQADGAASANLPVAALLVVPAGGRAASVPGAQPTVWVVNGKTGALLRQPVQIVSQTTGRVRVAGLEDGALVITAGAHKLDAGMKVRPVLRLQAAGEGGP